MDAAIPCCAEKRVEYLRKDVRVLVGVHVRNGESCGLNLLNLRFCLRCNFTGLHASGQGMRSEPFESIAESSRIGDRWEFGGVQDRFTIDQHDVAADTQSR